MFVLSLFQLSRPKEEGRFEPRHEISRPEKSDQPAYIHSLIRAFARRLDIL